MTTTASSTIDTQEVAQFAAIADQWWDEKGKFAPLHRLNPTRIAYLRAAIERHFGKAVNSNDAFATPLRNLSLVDIGCGGGLICEPMARLGASVTGVDAGVENIAVAKAHAQSSGLRIDYRTDTAEALAESGGQYDIVLALEIIEHVADTALFYRSVATLVKPGGLLVMSTINRTPKAYALAIIGAERILRWLPVGTHDWNKFVKPSEMAESLGQLGLSVTDTTGLTYHPLHGSFHLNPRDLDVNYLMCATKTA